MALGVLIALVAAIAAFVVAHGTKGRLREVEQRLRAIEAQPPAPAGPPAPQPTPVSPVAGGPVPPAVAFLLLGIVALLTLAAALLHGPALAGLGLVGAFVTPLLVASDAPNYWALYIYLAVVSAASFTLARIRLWRWLAITAVVFG